MMLNCFRLGYPDPLGWAAQERRTMIVADPLRTRSSLCTCTSRLLASGFLRAFTPCVHGLRQFVVALFAGRRRRRQFELLAGDGKQQQPRARRGLAGAINCDDRTVCLEFPGGCFGSVADPFGCARGSQLWWQSFPPKNAKFGG